jgi:hypothetical protein
MAQKALAKLTELTKIAENISNDSTQNNRTVSDVSPPLPSHCPPTLIGLDESGGVSFLSWELQSSWVLL